MNEVPAWECRSIVTSLSFVVKYNARPERPEDKEAPTLSDAIWEVAEQCWVRGS